MSVIPNQLMPLLASYDYEALKEDISRRGVIVPVIVNKATGEIIDGHHRVKIAEELGLEYPVEAVDLEDEAEARIVAVGLNVKRRRLSLEQRIELAVALRKDGWTQQEIGDALGVARRTVCDWLKEPMDGMVTNGETAEGVHPRANAKLSAQQKEEIFERAKTGEAQRSLAADYGVAKTSIHKAIKSVENKRAKSAKALAQTQAVADGTAVIYHRDCLEFLAGIAPRSADLLLTDPPYMTDVEDVASFAASWVDAALEKVKPSGRAYICTGAYPDELQAYLEALNGREDFTLANVLVWTYRNTLGPTPTLDYKLNWQAIFYLRGPDAAPLESPKMLEQFSVQDISAPDGRQGDRYHSWQKPLELADRLIRHSTKPGDLVIDPFACTGTFLLAASRLGRHAVGCDIDNDNIQIAVNRGCHAA